MQRLLKYTATLDASRQSFPAAIALPLRLMERLLASSQVEDFLARLRESIAQSEAVGIVSVEAAGEEWSGQEADVGLRRPLPFRPPNRPADIMTGQSAPFYGYYAGGNQAGQSSNPVTFSGSFPPRQVQHSPETPGVFSRTKELEALESVAAQNLKQRMILKWQLDIRASILRAQLEETEQEMQKNATELGFAGRQAQEIRDLRRQIDLNSMHVYQPPSSNSGGGPFAESERNLPPWEQAEQTRNSQVLLGAFVQRGALAASSAPLPPEELATRIASLGKDVAVGSVGDRQPLSPQPFLTPSKVTQEGSQIAHGKDAAGDEEGGEELVKRATSQAEDKGSRQEVVPDNSFSEGAGKAVKEPEENRAKQDVPIVGVETAGRSEVAGGNATGQKGAVAENQTKPQPGEGSSVSKRVQNEEEKEGRSEDQRKEEQKPNSTSAAPESRTESVHERRQSSGSKAERVATVEAPVPESERRPQIARRNADEGKRPEKDVQRSRESGGGRQEDAEKERGRPERVHHAGRVGEMLSEEKGRWMEKRKSPTTGISGAPAEKLKSSQVEYQMLQLKRRRWETPRKESDRQPQK
ncbi:hypothetical protein KFL_000270140 [Klebsormidium nitens]|uniref:Uncharacterized protein n=1 Tax=Klebsormidium nitens TaxID=105231 RepID=A0A1Y1HKW2_KLENI|nr:hypothetical protein KFL_000270140 [Klebsormidium nitens]|eukprot:GAQ79255.1 hypothetical protein KFL_000270140 [Klebsormidium nitens]